MFVFSVFLSFLLSKITWIALSFKKGGVDKNDILGDLLLPFAKNLNEWRIGDIQAFELVNFGQGFEGTTHTFNFVCTYSVAFFLIFLILKK